MKTKQEPKLSGVREIARIAKVSIGTVDRVINQRSGVSDKTRLLIEDIIKKMNYQPNILARRLASTRSLNFATLIPEVSKETEFWKAPLAGIEQAENEIRQFGINIHKHFFDQNDKQSFTKAAKKILNGSYDGVLLAPSFVEESTAFTQACKRKQIPYVLINSDLPDQDSLCYIGPDLFQSGYMGAHLLNYTIKDNVKILVINISKELENYHHVLRKEEGFRAFFRDHGREDRIHRIDIPQTSYKALSLSLKKTLTLHSDAKAIFVTNSRVSYVAQVMEELGLRNIMLVGYDFVAENLKYLENGIIDFLICNKPQEQGYRGVMSLYQTQLLKAPVEKIYYMSIDIITKENYKYYRN